MHTMLKGAFLALSATAIPVILNYLIKRRHKFKLKKLQDEKWEQDRNYYHCIFITMKNMKCLSHFNSGAECEDDNCSITHLNTLLRFLGSAKYSISLCMYMLTLRQVTDELIKAEDRGVNVRIITDNVIFKMQNSKTKLLKEKFGFDVRTPPYEDSFMHHKYCVIDAEDPDLKKMFLGSLNLTVQGCVKNFEFVCITNNPWMLNRYNDEFESLWNTFENSTLV
ncbi:mitochondrial cardiolipin hydrolase-like [Tribolium madens]|uniref:mitochondrial cardiolipin hydrolase-like n=1 Tax=Tribolium madens TaxID=41895 RepID=UPI001CF7329D|nr:mitochondrial cardiolipin hydrolase-like [Tribolium madens]XP_044271733.1 mitochondrial cardiolipin hydrolase-like [Tribolium madens]